MNGITYEQLKSIALGQKEFDFGDEEHGIDCFCGG
jgi:hypothetical protein